MKQIKKTVTMKLIERINNKQIEDILREDYIDNRLSIAQLAEKHGISVCTAQNWLRDVEIPRRKSSWI